MGQIVGGAAKPRRCNLQSLSQLDTPAAGEHILVSSDNSMTANGQGNFDCYIVGNGTDAATARPLLKINADLDERVDEIEELFSTTEKISDNYDSFIWAYINSSNGVINAQAESLGRRVLLYHVSAGQKYRVTGELLAANAIYTFIAFYAGDTAPVTGDAGTVIEAYTNAKKSVDREIRITEDGWLALGMYSSSQFNRYSGSDWQVYKTTYNDYQSQIDENANSISALDGRVGALESGVKHVESIISDDFDSSMWAFINASGSGSIGYQQESSNRKILMWRVKAGETYRITGTLSKLSAIYGYIATKEGYDEPQNNEHVTVHEVYSPDEKKTVDTTIVITANGLLIIGLSTYEIINRYNGTDWQVYRIEAIDNSIGGLYLPKKLTAVVGDTIQIFKRSLFKGICLDEYDVKAKCAKGKDFPRYWEFTPVAADAGTTSLNFKVCNYKRQVIDDVTAELTVKAAPHSPSSMKRIAVFGDSLTQAGTWVAEAARRLLSSDAGTATMPAGKGLSNIKFIGAMGEGNARYYGAGGWSWNSYTIEGAPAFRFQVTGVSTIVKGAKYTNNGFTYEVVENNTTNGSGNILCTTSAATNIPTASGTLTKSSGTGDASITFTSVAADAGNPLWDSTNQEISFTRYLSNIGESTVDCVVFLLGWNSVGADKTNFTESQGYMETLIGALHEQYPNAIVKILGLQLPSMNGGLAENYGSNGGYADKYALIRSVFAYNEFLQSFCESEDYNSFVSYVDVATQFDSENNMPETSVQVNTRNAKTEERGTNGVHPANAGYYQIADVVYRDLVKTYC